MMKLLIPFLMLSVFLPPLVAQQSSVPQAAVARPGSPPSRVETPKFNRIEYDMRALTVKPMLSEVEMKGKKMLEQRCALCHIRPATDVKVIGPDLSAETIERLGEGQARDQIMKGTPRMPGFQYGLDAAEINSIIAYLRTVKKQWWQP